MSIVDATSRTGAVTTGVPLARRSPRVSEADGLWATRRVGAWSWTTRDDWSHHLHENGSPDWTHLSAASGAMLIKANDGRQVWRVQVADELVFAKLYFPPRGWNRLRRWLIGSDSSRERHIAEYARAHGISTVRPVASADASRINAGPVSILITQGLPNAVPLNEVWAHLDLRAASARHIKNQIIDEVARLVAHAHQNGFEHTDLHAGNILLDANDGEYRALFVDLHNIRVGRPVSDRAVIRNLAQFHQWFRSRAPLTDRLRFLDRYLHWRTAHEQSGQFGRRLACEKDDLRTALDQAVHLHADTLYAQRDRRAMKSGRYFTRLKLRKGWRGHVFLKCKQPVPGSDASRMTFAADQWREWLADPLKWTRSDQTRYAIKKSASGVVCRSQLPAGGTEIDVICKRARPRTLIKRLKNLIRQSRAMRTWKLGNALLSRQIPTARPLAVVERRHLGVRRDSLVITEYIANAHDLDTVLTVELRELPPGRQQTVKRQVISSLASVIRSFHARGFIHRDLKAPNIMVQWDPVGEEPPRVLLVDLDGIRQRRSPRRRDWVRALARLNVSIDHCKRVSLADRLRFLKACLIGPGNPDPVWRDTWREITRNSGTKRDQNSRQFEKMIAKYGRI
jgi:serine/threonine protein kinase